MPNPLVLPLVLRAGISGKDRGRKKRKLRIILACRGIACLSLAEQQKPHKIKSEDLASGPDWLLLAGRVLDRLPTTWCLSPHQ